MANNKKTSWKKYWKPARSQYVTYREKDNNNNSFESNNFKSWLPEYYEGPTNRLIRYAQYDQMDLDHEVNAALDTIAEFSTLESGVTDLPFEVESINDSMTTKEIEIIQSMLRQWNNLNEFSKRIFRIFRNTIKYGDQFFIRDPETYKLMWVDPATVEKVQVNEAKAKEIEIYFIKDLDLNMHDMVATNIHTKHGTSQDHHSGSVISQSKTASQSPNTRPNTYIGLGGGSTSEAEATEVDATHVVHLSLTEGMDSAWPFGVSILERIYKIFKQKELLEDSILIYRIHRAPQRFAFNIHVGDMPPHRAQEYLEQVKNQINQKRIPSRDGEGMNTVDAAYNPMCVNISTKIPLLDGRELTLSELINEYEKGKENWVYSCDPVTGKVVPGPISWAGITKKDAKVIKLTFDNGESLTCTPDHKIPVLGKGFVEAGELTNKNKLINFSTFNKDSHSHIVSIDRVDRVEDVGTLTIDQEEKYHDYHTFAISAGIFIKNSMLENFYFTKNSEGSGSNVESVGGDMDGVRCFSMDTKIKLLDGRSLSIKEIESELQKGKELWSYSCHPVTGKIAPGLITWAGMTKKNTNVMKVTLDNGKSFIATPDHKFPIKGHGFVELKDLQEGQSLIPHYTKKEKIKKHTKDYEKVYCPHKNEWLFTHRWVIDELGDDISDFVHLKEHANDAKNAIHHMDCNRFNNNPDNLVKMNYVDHIKWHRDNMHPNFIGGWKRYYDNASEDELLLWKNKISETKKRNIANMSPEEYNETKKAWKINGKRANRAFIEKLNYDLEFRKKHRVAVKKGIRQSMKNNPDVWKERGIKISSCNIHRWADNKEEWHNRIIETQSIIYSSELFERMTQLYREKQIKNSTDFVDALNIDHDFMSVYKNDNINDVHSNVNITKFTPNNLRNMLDYFGLTWEKFKLLNKNVNVDDQLMVVVDSYFKVPCYKQSAFISHIKATGELNDLGIVSRHTLIKFLNERGLDTFKEFTEYCEFKNHRIVSIELLDEPMDVGTISIDEDEIHHDWHTFALDAGVFTKNSIDDMKYFNNKMLRALAVPSSYLPTGPDDGSQAYSDGRISAAFIQEFRFDRYCKRLQRSIVDMLDREFKLYLKFRGIEFDASDFKLKFAEPQNFSEYRQLEIDQMRINLFSSIQNVPFISNQYALKRYLGWTDVDIQENEKLWKKENSFSEIMDERESLVSDRDIKQMDMDEEKQDGEEDESTEMPAFDEDEVDFDEEDEEGDDTQF